MNFIVVSLLVYCLAREFFYQWSMQKLLNKFMSRNYYDYKISEDVGKMSQGLKIKEEDEIPEDLTILNEFMG